MPVIVNHTFRGPQRWYQIFARALYEWEQKGRLRVFLGIDTVGVQNPATIRTEFYKLRTQVNSADDGEYPADFVERINAVRISICNKPLGIIIYPIGKGGDMSADLTESVAISGVDNAARQKFTGWLSQDHAFGDTFELADGPYGLEDRAWFLDQAKELEGMVTIKFTPEKITAVYIAQ